MNIVKLRDELTDMIQRYGADREVEFYDKEYDGHEIQNVYLYYGRIILGEGERLTSLDPEY